MMSHFCWGTALGREKTHDGVLVIGRAGLDSSGFFKNVVLLSSSDMSAGLKARDLFFLLRSSTPLLVFQAPHVPECLHPPNNYTAASASCISIYITTDFLCETCPRADLDLWVKKRWVWPKDTELWVRRCACGGVILPCGVIMFDVFMFMHSGDSWNRLGPLPLGWRNARSLGPWCRCLLQRRLTTWLTGRPRLSGGNLTWEYELGFFADFMMHCVHFRGTVTFAKKKYIMYIFFYIMFIEWDIIMYYTTWMYVRQFTSKMCFKFIRVPIPFIWLSAYMPACHIL